MSDGQTNEVNNYLIRPTNILQNAFSTNINIVRIPNNKKQKMHFLSFTESFVKTKRTKWLY